MWCCSPHMWPGSPADPPTSGTCPLWSAHSRGGVLAELGLPFPPAASSGRSRGHPRGGRSGCLLGGPGLASSLQLLGAVPAPPCGSGNQQCSVTWGEETCKSCQCTYCLLGRPRAQRPGPWSSPDPETRASLCSHGPKPRGSACDWLGLRPLGGNEAHGRGREEPTAHRRLGWATGPRRGLEMRGQTAACMRGQCSPAGWGTPRRLGKIGSAPGDRAAVPGRGGESGGAEQTPAKRDLVLQARAGSWSGGRSCRRFEAGPPGVRGEGRELPRR